MANHANFCSPAASVSFAEGAPAESKARVLRGLHEILLISTAFANRIEGYEERNST